MAKNRQYLVELKIKNNRLDILTSVATRYQSCSAFAYLCKVYPFETSTQITRILVQQPFEIGFFAPQIRSL